METKSKTTAKTKTKKKASTKRLREDLSRRLRRRPLGAFLLVARDGEWEGDVKGPRWYVEFSGVSEDLEKTLRGLGFAPSKEGSVEAGGLTRSEAKHAIAAICAGLTERLRST